MSYSTLNVAGVETMITPPEGKPVYRLLTGKDDSAFCRRVSDALSMGYRLYGSPSCTYNGQDVILAQAVLWPTTPAPKDREESKEQTP